MPPSTASSARADSRDAILDAAETVFCKYGFDGASMKAVAQAAGVAQSLLHYHFGNKDGLYLAVFQRRADAINDFRNASLDKLIERGAPTVEEVLESLLRPTVQLGRGKESNFSQLLMLVIVSRDERSKSLISDSFDAYALRVIEVLRQTLPGLSDRDAVWGYIFSISISMTMMAPTGRAGRLSHGECDDSDIDTLLREVVVFAAAGLRAFADRARSRTAQDGSRTKRASRGKVTA